MTELGSDIAQTQPKSETNPALMHELSQSLTTISAYIWGCIHRLSVSDPEKETILYAMNKAMQDIEHAQQIVHKINRNTL